MIPILFIYFKNIFHSINIINYVTILSNYYLYQTLITLIIQN